MLKGVLLLFISNIIHIVATTAIIAMLMIGIFGPTAVFTWLIYRTTGSVIVTFVTGTVLVLATINTVVCSINVVEPAVRKFYRRLTFSWLK